VPVTTARRPRRVSRSLAGRAAGRLAGPAGRLTGAGRVTRAVRGP
jgi:hypothetical protein